MALGDADIVMTGGSENMSQAPFAIRNARWGINLGENREVRNESEFLITKGNEIIQSFL